MHPDWERPDFPSREDILAFKLLHDGEKEAASDLLLESSERRTSLDAVHHDIVSLQVAVQLGHGEAVATMYERNQEVSTQFPSRNSIASVQRVLGDAVSFLGDPSRALKHYEVAVEQCRTFRNRPELALSRLGIMESSASDAVDCEAVESLLAEFAGMGMRPALARAEGLTHPSRISADKDSEKHALLTERESEVLGLLALGKTNAEIASQLVISRNTVRRHVSNIFDKTGVANRAQAAVYARDYGLV